MLVEGKIELVEERSHHVVELRVDNVLHMGAADSNKYPLSNVPFPSELVRDCPHFAARTTAVSTKLKIASD